MNCRSIPKETWEHVRQALTFYFSRRHCREDAEDLAQETLLAIWNRGDYEFEKEEDFPRVCYAFAGRILMARRRNVQRYQYVELDPAMSGSQEPVAGLKPSELSVFLDELQEVGRSRLKDREWQLIYESMDSDAVAATEKLNAREAGNLRVYLHRARKKLARLSGWRNDRDVTR
jgi:DNA-directed RNA polymerase specialized sigma24 family protein